MVPELRPYEVVKAKMPEHPACTMTPNPLDEFGVISRFYGSLFFIRLRGLHKAQGTTVRFLTSDPCV